MNAKVVLIGEGTVGKTSLAHRLIEDRYVVRDRTHGMNVWPLDIPLPLDATLQREALLWDLAGQEDYRLIHRDGRASGQKIYVQLKSGNSYLRKRQRDGREVFDVKNKRHLTFWIKQPVDVYLVIRQTDERSGDGTIRWMNMTRYLKNRKDKTSRQIVFEGERLDMQAVWKLVLPSTARQGGITLALL